MRGSLAWLLCILLLVAGLPRPQSPGCGTAGRAHTCSCGDACAGTDCTCGCATPGAPKEPQRAPERDSRIELTLPAQEPLGDAAFAPADQSAPRTALGSTLRAARAHPLQAELRVFLI